MYVQCSVPYFDNTRTAINFISYFRTKYASVKTWKDSEDPRADLGPPGCKHPLLMMAVEIERCLTDCC